MLVNTSIYPYSSQPSEISYIWDPYPTDLLSVIHVVTQNGGMRLFSMIHTIVDYVVRIWKWKQCGVVWLVFIIYVTYVEHPGRCSRLQWIDKVLPRREIRLKRYPTPESSLTDYEYPVKEVYFFSSTGIKNTTSYRCIPSLRKDGTCDHHPKIIYFAAPSRWANTRHLAF